MRHGRREFRPAVAGLEGRQLLSNAPAVSTVASFHGASQSVISPLVMDGQGNLFGTTCDAGNSSGKADATVFEIPAGSKTVETLASFNGRSGYVIGGLSVDPRGDLYGTISGEGGSIGNGMAFEIAAGTKTVTPLASFNNYGGEFPSSVIVDARGDVFGTAAFGGELGTATAYEIPSGTQAITPLAAFSGTAPAPKGVVEDAQGNLYGTDQGGGPYGAASVYEIPRGSGVVAPLVTFNGIDGPGVSNVTLDAQGNLYGTTEDGGLYGDGAIFEIVKGSNTPTTLATFNTLNGSAPDPSVGIVRDARGDLFGTTTAGGLNGYGTVFEVPVGTQDIVTLAAFKTSGQQLVGGLTLDGKGDLYGTVDGTGDSGGTVFKLTLPPPG